MSASTLPPQAAPPPQLEHTMATPSTLPAHRRSLFPPIPAPLQRLFDLVPLVVYPPNALPGDDAYDCGDDAGQPADETARLPTLFVFIDPADAARGRASFNPTCLKWQTYLRFAGVPVRLAASTNHASPTGALPFLQPPREPEPQLQPPDAARQNARQRTRLPPPPRPVPTSEFAKYAKTRTTATTATTTTASTVPVDALTAIDARAPAYQALLDTSLRRAWLHTVYLDDGNTSQATVASRLYADAASASLFVRTALAGQLRAAAASEVWGAASTATPSAFAVAHIYKDAAVALSALQSVLEDNDDDDDGGAPFFFNSTTPTIFDAAVFSYTHLLLEDSDDNSTAEKRFRWHNTALADLVRGYPLLVRHRNTIVARYWGEAKEPQGAPSSNAEDSTSWVSV